jgi:hypothetical protein
LNWANFIDLETSSRKDVADQSAIKSDVSYCQLAGKPLARRVELLLTVIDPLVIDEVIGVKYGSCKFHIMGGRQVFQGLNKRTQIGGPSTLWENGESNLSILNGRD